MLNSPIIFSVLQCAKLTNNKRDGGKTSALITKTLQEQVIDFGVLKQACIYLVVKQPYALMLLVLPDSHPH